MAKLHAFVCLLAGSRGLKGNTNKRFLHSGSKARYNGDSRRHVLQDSYVHVVS